MVTYKAMQAQEIVQNPMLSADGKIEQLLELESEARGLQRAASESPMNDCDGWEDDLREIRLALGRLGWREPIKGAASL
ncbi:MAG: hypothetical protein JNL61_03440 [Rhizobiaceae bacterium]|nr:hypothetical protein [Rhizobiaceae bacterium]